MRKIDLNTDVLMGLRPLICRRCLRLLRGTATASKVVMDSSAHGFTHHNHESDAMYAIMS